VQASMLSELSKKGINWHVNKPADPNLMFLLKSVGNLNSDKILFCIFFQDRSLEGKDKDAKAAAEKEKEKSKGGEVKTRIDLVEKEGVRKTILIEQIVSAKQVPDKPCKVEIVYMMDAATAKGKKPEKKVIGKDGKEVKPVLKAFMLAFTFVSRRDAHDACLLLHQYATKSFLGFSFGQVCLHKGYVEKQRKSKVSWVKRYAPARLLVPCLSPLWCALNAVWRLLSGCSCSLHVVTQLLLLSSRHLRSYLRLVCNRLLCYRNHDSPFPVNVIELVSKGARACA
jgi:hypothetical protein